jgi:hypothetical protein
MSGGKFDYLQSRYEWDDAERIITKHIRSNPYEFSSETIEQFKIGLKHMLTAKIYLQRIDWLLSGDDGEEYFHKRLLSDLKHMEEHK